MKDASNLPPSRENPRAFESTAYATANSDPSGMERTLKAIGEGLLFVSYCAWIYWLSDQPAVDIPPLFAHQDKLHHAGAYAIMAICAWRFFRHFIDDPMSIAGSTLAYCSLFGLTDELHQVLVPSRSADWLDWLADTMGAGFSAMAGYYITRRSIVRSKNRTVAPGNSPNDTQ